jgi:hypothetical protein
VFIVTYAGEYFSCDSPKGAAQCMVTQWTTRGPTDDLRVDKVISHNGSQTYDPSQLQPITHDERQMIEMYVKSIHALMMFEFGN